MTQLAVLVLMTIRSQPSATRFPYTTLFRSEREHRVRRAQPVDLGLVRPMHVWARGGTLTEVLDAGDLAAGDFVSVPPRSEEHTSELQSRGHLVCRLLIEKKTKS